MDETRAHRIGPPQDPGGILFCPNPEAMESHSGHFGFILEHAPKPNLCPRRPLKTVQTVIGYLSWSGKIGQVADHK